MTRAAQQMVLRLVPKRRAHVSHNSGCQEWYTPVWIIELAREALGGIDLDPASNTTAQEVVRAWRYFTAEDDGLSREWWGRVWLNPPYSRPLINQFCDKLVGEVASGRVTEAIVLTNNATETRWAQTLLRNARALCFPHGRIRFWSPARGLGAPIQGQMILYFGGNHARFCRLFGPLGWAWGVEP